METFKGKKSEETPHRVKRTLLLILFTCLMGGVVLLANFLVKFDYHNLFTYGSFVYSFIYLVLDLTNRMFGPKLARRVVYVGLVIAISWTFVVSGTRIAIAAGIGNACSQLLDVFVFNKLRASAKWWHAPWLSSILAAFIDSYLFFALAFAGTGNPWWIWATANLIIIQLMNLVVLLPFRLLMPYIKPV